MREKREKTGYYDKNGKEIRDDDKIKVHYGEEILIGTVHMIGGVWYLIHPTFGYGLNSLNDVEILEGE